MNDWERFTAQGREFLEQGDYPQAFKAFYQAITCDSRQLEGWTNLAKALRFLEIVQPNDMLKKTLIDCLAKPIVNHQDLAFAGISLLKLQPQQLSDPLLLGLMEKTILVDTSLERLLTQARRDLLLHAQESDSPFITALAKQCNINEYVYAVTDQEQALIKTMSSDKPILACYQATQAPERVELKDIPTWGTISDAISQKVQAQYEENPYPRWTSLSPVETPPRFPEPQQILIAGCGTGQHALNTAQQYKNSQILALDLSRASLSYAMTKAHAFNISNISFLQADILEMASFPQQFDLIECTGVLHHMAQPVAGWRVLKQLLKPEGMMHVGLYSEIGRQDVVAARRYIEGEKDIRTCRQMLIDLPEDHPAKEVTRTIDFFTLSRCRDLLFHVQEHCFTLPQIADILKELDLVFLGFDLRDNRIKNQFKARYPMDAQMKSLALWDEFEKEHPQTFRGMYQFWVSHLFPRERL